MRIGAGTSRVYGIGKEVHLPLERVEPTKCFRVEHLHEHRRAPSLWSIGPTVSSKARGHRFDEQSEREPFVACIDPSQWQQRALGLIEQCSRIVGRVAFGIDQPCSGETLPRAHLLLRISHAGDAGRDVDEDGIARRG